MPTDEGYEVIAARLEGAVNTAKAEMLGEIKALHESLNSNKQTADRAHTRIDQLEARQRQLFMLCLSGILFPLFTGAVFFLLTRGT